MTSTSDNYVRANQSWVCGGVPGECDQCPGPLGSHCSRRPLCQPIKMEGHWVCTLDPKLGPCALGPLPDGQCCKGPAGCSPKPSLRYRRQAFVWFCIAISYVGLSFGLSNFWRSEFLAPGPLSSHHAQALKGEGIHRCAACHAAANQSITQWLASTVIGRHHATTSQPQLCLECHGEQFSAALALAAHNLEPATLEQLTAKWSDEMTNVAAHQTPIACSTCHREHHGSDSDLRQLTDRQCQTCHASQIRSFESDHVEFAATYPARRRSRIAFDHVAHQQVHFAGKNRAFDCRTCHVGDPLQNVQLLASFETTCQECHQQQISGGESLVLFSLPSIDVKAIQGTGMVAPQWPASAATQFDGGISPLLKVLLAADPDVQPALSQMHPDFQFGDVDPADVEQVRLAATIADGIRTLLEELAVDPRETLRRRLAHSFDGDEDAQRIDAWLDHAPLNSLISFSSDWMAADTVLTEPSANVDRDRWLLDNNAILARITIGADSTFRQQETDELVPNPLKGMLNAQEGQGMVPPAAAAAPKTDSNSGAIPSAINPLPNGSAIPDDELLANNPLRDGALLKPSPESPPALDEHLQNDRPLESPTVAAIPSIASNDGWRVDARTWTISYRPTQHQDAGLQSLFNLVAGAANKNDHPVVDQLFQDLKRDVGVGTCGKCHTVDRDGKAHLVNWSPAYRDPTIRGFTSFSHRPHLVGPSATCTSCHQLRPEPVSRTDTPFDDPHSFASDFSPIAKSTCASCHRAGSAKSACIDCHNYHIGTRVRVPER